MKPTLIKTCGYRPNPDNDYEVELQMDTHAPKDWLPEFCLIYEDDKRIIGIKEGFTSDGMSLPVLSWSIIRISPFDRRTAFGGFIHDGLYRSHLLPQYDSDVILNNILCIPPSPNWIQRQLIYQNLRWFGHIAYNSKTDAEIEHARKFVTVIEKRKLTGTVIKK